MASALGLLVCMFFLAWYDVDGIPGQVRAGHGVVWTEDAWHGLTIVRWVMLATILAALGGVGLHWHERSRATQTSTAGWVAGLGAATVALLIYRVLIELPSTAEVPDQKLGALLGLACAVGIALGGWECLRAQRGRKPSRIAAPERETGA